MNSVKTHLDMLGLKVEDRVTGFSGVVATISFDLYGCIQAIVNPGLQQDGKLGESHWFDVNRLRVIDQSPVMDRPCFEFGLIAEGKHGPAEKPAFGKA